MPTGTNKVTDAEVHAALAAVLPLLQLLLQVLHIAPWQVVGRDKCPAHWARCVLCVCVGICVCCLCVCMRVVCVCCVSVCMFVCLYMFLCFCLYVFFTTFPPECGV